MAIAVPRLRLWHLLGLVGAAGLLFAMLEYRRTVFDPYSQMLRQARYGNVAGRVEALRKLRGVDPRKPGALEAALGALRDEAPGVRAEAATVLGEFLGRVGPGPHARVIQGALTEALADVDPRVRAWAATELAIEGVRTEEIQAILVRATRAGEVRDRVGALTALGVAWALDDQARGLELAATRSRDPELLGQALLLPVSPTLSLARVRPAVAIPEPVVRAVLERIDDEPGVRDAAVRCVGLFGYRAGPAIPKLASLLSERAPDSRVAAAEALSALGPDAEEAMPALRDLAATTRKRTLVDEVIEAIEVKCQLLQVTVPKLATDLVGGDAASRIRAAKILGGLGPKAQAALPALERSRDDPDPDVRRAVADALRAIDVVR